MLASRRIVLAVCALGGFAALSPAAAVTLVKVTLGDKGAAAEMPTGLQMGMADADMSKAPLMVKADVSSVKSGDVEFDVTNTSKDQIHEMLVVPVPASGQLPYKASDSAIDEDAAGSLGEVAELDPGKSGTLTLNLAPGKYALLCNVPGHFDAGMWTLLTVEP